MPGYEQLTVHVIVRNPEHMARSIAAVSLDGHPIERARVERVGTGEQVLEIRLGNTERVELSAISGEAGKR